MRPLSSAPDNPMSQAMERQPVFCNLILHVAGILLSLREKLLYIYEFLD